MNLLDSELIAAELTRAGYEQVDNLRRADIILFNTCSVRQHAEDKIYSALGRLKQVKAEQPEKSSESSAAWPKRTGRRYFAGPHTWTWSWGRAGWGGCRQSCSRSPPAVGHACN